jgi:protein tyrosine/serine phosphatase
MKNENRKTWLAAAVFLSIASGAPARLSAAETLESLKNADWSGSLSPAFALVESFALAPADAPTQNLPDFAKVSDALYRSGQPTQQEIAQLPGLGIKTILKLNSDDPAESDWAAGADVTLVPELLDNQNPPTFEQVDAALAVITDPARQPVLVHCHLGHDRTSIVVAAYEVTVAGMGVDQAAADAKTFGYSNPRFPNLTTWLPSYAAHRAALSR